MTWLELGLQKKTLGGSSTAVVDQKIILQSQGEVVKSLPTIGSKEGRRIYVPLYFSGVFVLPQKGWDRKCPGWWAKSQNEWTPNRPEWCLV